MRKNIIIKLTFYFISIFFYKGICGQTLESVEQMLGLLSLAALSLLAKPFFLNRKN